VNALGYVAGALTTLAFLPQVVRSVQMRDATGLSWLWLVCFGTGVTGWIVYGIARRDVAISATNGVTLLAVLVLIWLRATTWRRTGSQEGPRPAPSHAKVSDEHRTGPGPVPGSRGV
jgi:MtN3 and saliva related transmembrane protein